MIDVAGKKVAILVANYFEQIEMTAPRKALDQSGVATYLVSPDSPVVQGVHHEKPGNSFKVNVALEDFHAMDYDALLIPGGLMSPDQLRNNATAVEAVKSFYEAGKPIFAICHGPWLLVEAGILEDMQVTSYPSIRTDIVNAGGNWVDREVVVDDHVVTSRSPDDLEAFSHAIIEELGRATLAPLRM